MKNKGKNTEFTNDSDNSNESPKDSLDSRTNSTPSTFTRSEMCYPQTPQNTPFSSNGDIDIKTPESSNGNGGTGSSGGSGFGG
jgi:hypothetical protein